MSDFILTGFSDEIDADFSIQLKEINNLDIAYIEIRGVNGRNIIDHSIDEVISIKKQLELADIKISAIGSPIGKINIEDDFKSHFETFKHTIAIAKVLETQYIRIFSFFMDAYKAAFYRDEVIRRMTALKDYVAGTEIVLLHENEKDIYGDTPERCLDLYKTINSDNFKLIFDPANFVQCGIETYPYAYELLKDYVVYYHIKDALMVSGKVVPSGFGDGHIKEILSNISHRGFKGFLSLEPHLGHFEGFNNLEGDGDIPEFEEKSDINKFKFAADSLKNILKILRSR